MHPHRHICVNCTLPNNSYCYTILGQRLFRGDGRGKVQVCGRVEQTITSWTLCCFTWLSSVQHSVIKQNVPLKVIIHLHSVAKSPYYFTCFSVKLLENIESVESHLWPMLDSMSPWKKILRRLPCLFKIKGPAPFASDWLVVSASVGQRGQSHLSTWVNVCSSCSMWTHLTLPNNYEIQVCLIKEKLGS